MGLDILGIDIMGIVILGIDIVALPQICPFNYMYHFNVIAKKNGAKVAHCNYTC